VGVALTLGVTAGHFIESIEALNLLAREPPTMSLNKICIPRATFIAEMGDTTHAAAEAHTTTRAD